MFNNHNEKEKQGDTTKRAPLVNYKNFEEYMQSLKKEIDVETENVFNKVSRTSPILNPSAVGIHSNRNRALLNGQKRTRSMQLPSNFAIPSLQDSSTLKSFRLRRHSSAMSNPFNPKSRTEYTSEEDHSFETISDMTESTDLSDSSSSSENQFQEENKYLRTRQKRSLDKDITEYQNHTYRELFAPNHLFSLDKIVHACLLNYFDDDEFVGWFLDIYPSFTDCNTLFKILKKTFFEIYDRSVLDISSKNKEEHRKITMEALVRVVKFLEKFIEQDGDKITASSSEEIFAVISQLQHIFKRVFELPKKRKTKKNNEKSIEDRITQLGKLLSQKTHFFTITVQSTDPVELIVQITLVEHGIFQKMSKAELLRETLPSQGSLPCSPSLPVGNFLENKEIGPIQSVPTQTWASSPTLASFWVHSDKIIRWVCSTILNCTDLADRVAVLKKFISAAKTALSIRNYNAVFEVTAALVCRPIRRLQQTWSEIEQDDFEQYQKLVRFCNASNNYGEYRQEFFESGPPCTPFLEAHLRYMQSLVSNNLCDSPSIIHKLKESDAEKPCIDMHTRLSVIDELNKVLNMQKGDYPFKVSNSVRDFISWQFATNLKDAETLEKVSHEIEPETEE